MSVDPSDGCDLHWISKGTGVDIKINCRLGSLILLDLTWKLYHSHMYPEGSDDKPRKRMHDPIGSYNTQPVEPHSYPRVSTSVSDKEAMTSDVESYNVSKNISNKKKLNNVSVEIQARIHNLTGSL